MVMIFGDCGGGSGEHAFGDGHSCGDRDGGDND